MMKMMSGTSASISKPLFHSPHRLIVGNAPLVGVLDLPGTYQRPPIRLFFPATTDTTNAAADKNRMIPKPARYFVNNRVAYFLQGFAHVALARHTTRLYRWFLRPLLWLLSLIFPVRYFKIPGTVHVKTNSDASVVKYVPPSSLTPEEKKDDGGVGWIMNNGKQDETNQKRASQSLVIFSHGLTGTGEENSIFCTSLAKRGYVVASIHHRDGSSCRVPLPDGTCRYYEHFPTGDDYDPRHRLEQVHVRAKEFLYSCSWLMGDHDDDGGGDKDDAQRIIVDQIRPYLNEQNVIAAGFSYGAATVSLAATLEPTKFQCAILLDAWLHIDYSSRGVEFDFPPEAFGAGWPQAAATNTDEKTGVTEDVDFTKKKKGLNIPSLFINSFQFQGYAKLNRSTHKLADQINSYNNNNKDENKRNQRAEMHVIPGTKHQNFCDIVFWVPLVPWRCMKKICQLGDADAYEAYKVILNRTIQFLERF